MKMESMHQEVKERVGEWTVVEKFTAPKDPEIGVEDGMYLGPNIAFVCDGVTSQTREKINGLSPGQFAVDAAIRALKSPEGQKVTSQELVPFLTKHVLGALARARISDKHIPRHPSFVFVAFFPKENKIVRVRDCQYLIDGKGNNPGFPADTRKRQMQERILRYRRAHGLEENEEDLKQTLREWQWKHRNSKKPSKYSYGVIDGDDVPTNLIEFIDVPADAKEIVLASDGYHSGTLAPTLAESNHRVQLKMQEGDFYVDDLMFGRIRHP